MTREERWQKECEDYEREYEHFYMAFGVDSNAWDMLYKHYAWYTWRTGSCKKRIIAQYLVWEELVPRLKEYGITYYSGIDTFLEEWRDTIHNELSGTYKEIEKEDNMLNNAK